MLSKKHFEAMAEHIARETKPGSREREGAMHLAISTAKASNPRFDEGRFRSAVDGLTSGTHMVDGYKTGDGKSHSTLADATKHASDVFKRTGNVISVEKAGGRIRRVGGSSGVKKLSSGAKGSKAEQFRKYGKDYAEHLRSLDASEKSSGGGAGDEPRDDHGRWTK